MDNTANDIFYDTYNKLRELWDITLEPEWLKKAYDCLKTHAEWEYQNIKKGITKPFSEIKIDQNNIDKTNNGYFGILDYVNLQKAQVIDWKTGSYPTVSFEYRMQAHVYKILFESKFDTKLKDFYFFYLYPNQWRKISYTNPKQIEAGKECDYLLSKILDNGYEKKPRLENSCRYCDFKYYCKVIEEPYQIKNEIYKNIKEDSDVRKQYD